MLNNNKYITALASISIIANTAGVRSTQQLSVFLHCAMKQGRCLADILDLPSNDPEYRKQLSLVRQLMFGSPARGYNGANVLQWGEKIHGKEKAVILTVKGQRLFKEALKLLE
ncbi:hypothetical protein FXF61_00395 [Pseudomonas sp. C27(2019)]|uniref:hypothetical protein n=1 Tax=Pseudomonas sp. C27(2019) TaxID=2604941 RepID=UPI001245BC16|nr:hypothetical protein [Pseudomonas sp. C27(2019)]QEY57730.1 hypothetical protein FXF61_00395 [Pseudomonas sp. C27(2019)]